ncbi:heavy metal-binding domain-containing protein [Desulforhopalus vacuolatus]|uniref:YbjQ family protein n=1 Tax=Desulforhopalus vacuolatus TaxID=40414 RepID=UPI0019634E7C|nr:heavy metal-binding domain-containing protein [Desulforhopalus vacuolatus]MBM9518916.1 heavy metal-binding domain-containing protein [Desulforhopalus vacuolatus]
MDRVELLSGTRPDIKGGKSKIIITGADGFDGYEIMEYKGMAWGISVRAKDLGQDCAMGCKQFTGGELTSYSQLGEESRQRAIDKMLQMANRQNANAVVHVEFELTGAAQGASEVVVHGTAVVIKPIINYVPAGAIGNILADMQENFEKNQILVKSKK